MLRIFIAGFLSAALCLAQQTISVGNAANPFGGVAPGSILSIQQQSPPKIIGSLDPTRVSVRVRPLGSMAALDAPLQPSPLLAIWAQLPASTPLGPADVTLIVDGITSVPAPIMVMRSSFGLFTQAGNGLGAAAAQNQDNALIKLTNPILAGQYVTLWGTGLGAATLSEVTIELGGSEITPTYAGPSSIPGVDQINFQIPDTSPLNGCYVSLIVKAGGVLSNGATIAKASHLAPCEHPFGLSDADLATLDSGGPILFGTVHLQSDVGLIPLFGTEGAELARASAQFALRDAFDIGLLAQPLITDDSYFGCHVAPSPGLTVGPVFSTDIDAGDSVTLSGAGRTITLPGDIGLYSATAFDMGQMFFAPGIWRIEGLGGKTIGPFQADLALPPAAHVTNRDSVTLIDRGRDQDVLWDPSGYTDTDVATVNLSLTRLAALGSSAGQILCRAPATTGKLTIPSSLLSTLPVGSAILRLGIAPRPDRRVLFPLPLTDGSTAHALFDYSFSETVPTQTR